MQTFVTGYQYGARKQFIGQYVFETHVDFDPHLPPNTVLVEPPAVPSGKEAIWNGSGWNIQDAFSIPVVTLPEVVAPKLEIPEIPHDAMDAVWKSLI